MVCEGRWVVVAVTVALMKLVAETVIYVALPSIDVYVGLAVYVLASIDVYVALPVIDV